MFSESKTLRNDAKLHLLQGTIKKKASLSRSLKSLGNLAESFKQFRAIEANLLVVISLLLPIASLLCGVLFERASHQTSRCPALICNTPTYVFKVRLGTFFIRVELMSSRKL